MSESVVYKFLLPVFILLFHREKHFFLRMRSRWISITTHKRQQSLPQLRKKGVMLECFSLERVAVECVQQLKIEL